MENKATNSHNPDRKEKDINNNKNVDNTENTNETFTNTDSRAIKKSPAKNNNAEYPLE